MRVLDFSSRTPGPICTQTLGDLGADVVKIESPAGDYTRRMRGEFEAANRNKRSLVLDLARPEALEIARLLAASSDVVVETFRPGVADRLGVGRHALIRLRPGLVYCSLSSFGQRGWRRTDAGHDLGFLALAGALAAPARWAGEAPARSPIAVVDVVAGLYAAIAIQAALLRRATTGEGAHLDLALSAAALAATSFRPTLLLEGGAGLHLSPVNDVFEARDGRRLTVSAIGEPAWERLRDALAPLEPRLLDARFASESDRLEAGDELHALLRAVFGTRPRSFWLRRLRGAGVAAEPVLAGPEVLAQPAVLRSGLLETEGSGPGRVRFPVAFDGAHPNVRLPPPALGEHAREILAELGLDAGEIDRLLRSGAAGSG